MKFASLGLVLGLFIANLSAYAFPVVNSTSPLDLLDHDAREILRRATPAAPHFVVYADSYDPSTTGPPAVSAIKVMLSSLNLSSYSYSFYYRDSMSCKFCILIILVFTVLIRLQRTVLPSH